MPKTKDGGWILDDSGMSPYEPISEEEARALCSSDKKQTKRKATPRKQTQRKRSKTG